MSEMYVKIFGVLLSFLCYLFLSSALVVFTEPHRSWNKVLWNQSKSVILQKPNTLIDGQWWVEAVRNHVHYLPHLHIMIIRNTYLPFHFNDVPPPVRMTQIQGNCSICFCWLFFFFVEVWSRRAGHVSLEWPCAVLNILKNNSPKKSGHLIVNAFQSSFGYHGYN